MYSDFSNRERVLLFVKPNEIRLSKLTQALTYFVGGVVIYGDAMWNYNLKLLNKKLKATYTPLFIEKGKRLFFVNKKLMKLIDNKKYDDIYEYLKRDSNSVGIIIPNFEESQFNKFNYDRNKIIYYCPDNLTFNNLYIQNDFRKLCCGFMIRLDMINELHEINLFKRFF